MADQRRRGRGRSGRGGRIPRRGDGHGGPAVHEEQFVSFPLEVTSPITVRTAVDPAGIEAVLTKTLEQERRQAEALRAAVAASGDGTLEQARSHVERHGQALEQLARELGVSPPAGSNGSAGPAGAEELVAGDRLARLGWLTLQRAAYASGDPRIDQAVRPVLREKERLAQVLEAYAVRQAARALFPDPQE